MTGMEWARADMDPDDPGSQGYSPGPEPLPDEFLSSLAAIKAALVEKQQQWVLQTVRITLLATELYAPDVIEWWMQQPNKALSGRVPATVIAAGHANEVEQLLQGLADGVMG